LMTVQLCKALGAERVILVGTRQSRLELGARLGADVVVDARPGNAVAAVREAAGKRGVDLVIEASGAAEAPQQCIEMVRRGGKVLVVAYYKEPVRLDLGRAVREDISVAGTRGAGGNVSARVPGSEEILITRTGVILGEVTPDDVVPIDPTGRPLDPQGPRPSKEVPFHTVVYRLRPDVNAIIHLHPCYAVVQSLRLADLPLLPSPPPLPLGRPLPSLRAASPAPRLLPHSVASAWTEARTPRAAL